MVKVLNIRDARRRLPELVKTASGGAEEIHVGAHGQDEATLIASSRLRALRSELVELRRRLAAVQGRPISDALRPFAELEDALAEGRIGTPLRPDARRFLPGLRTVSETTWEEMAERGNAGQVEPTFRRLPPVSP